MTVRFFLATFAAAAISLSVPAFAQGNASQRPAPSDKKSWSQAVGAQIKRQSALAVIKARELGLDGDFEVSVGCTISVDGKVSDARIVTSSGNPDLDAVAIDMANRAAPFPTFTPDMGEEPVSLVAPIILKLKKPKTADTLSEPAPPVAAE
jgi:TonB family protein